MKVQLFWVVYTDVVAQAFAHFITMWTRLLHQNIALVNRGDVQFQVVVAVCRIGTLGAKLVLHSDGVVNSLRVLFQAGPGEKRFVTLVTVECLIRFSTRSSAQMKMQFFESLPTNLAGFLHVIRHVLSLEVCSHD